MSAYTKEQLAVDGLRPTMDLLLKEIPKEGYVTYGEIAEKLSQHFGVPVSPRSIGIVAGAIQNRIHEVAPGAPLINSLIVNSTTRKASDGVNSYLTKRFEGKGRQRIRSKLREEYLQKAVAEAHEYTEWEEVYKALFHQNPPNVCPTSSEGDDSRPWGKEGESEEHRRLKNFVLNNPKFVGINHKKAKGTTEHPLLSGDFVDVFFKVANKAFVIEVKSKKSNDNDLERGVYQCIKYQAVYEAMQIRWPNIDVKAILATQRDLTPKLRKLANEYRIKHVIVSDQDIRKGK